MIHRFLRIITIIGLLLMLLLLIFFVAYPSSEASSDCLVKEYGEYKQVCVCNSEHCDYYPINITPNKVNVVSSTRAGSRYKKSVQDIDTMANSKNLITIDRSKTFQKIHGFGGAFTDAAGINIISLPTKAADHLMRSYFSEMGSSYNLCRVPMAGSDYSTHSYSYDDGPEDKNLTNFKLADEDLKYKIPLMKLALNMSNGETPLRFFGSSWIAPKWMKENGDYLGGSIKKEHYQTWADYFLKFLEEYEKNGLDFWGITTGNEPNYSIYSTQIPSVKWSAEEASIWIRENLGPTLRSSNFSDIKIMAIDDTRPHFFKYVYDIMENDTTRSYIDGLAVHWYVDTNISSTVLTKTHESFPDKFIIYTEASSGFLPWHVHVDLGSWERGEEYADDIIDNINHWVTGWVDWNLVLDTTGGPNSINQPVDAAIIVNTTAGEFYKQPMYYALGHFSKFIPEGSSKIETHSNIDLPMVALARPGSDKKIVLVLLNKNNTDISLSVKDGMKYINLNLEKRSITTVIY